MTNTVADDNGNLDETKKKAFDEEVKRWISEGILEPWDVSGVLLLMAIEQ